MNSVLVVLCFVSVLLLESQSAASYPTYVLALSMLFSFRHWNDLFQVRMSWIIVALLGYLTISSFWSQPFAWRETATTASRALLVSFFVAAVAECQIRGQVRRWLGRAMAVVGLAAVIAALANFVITDPADGRLNGLGQLDTHVIAALVFAAVLVFILDLAYTDRSWRWLALLCGLLIGLAIFLSDSRNAWVSAMIGVGVFLLSQHVRHPLRFLAAVAAVGVVLSVLLASLLVDGATREMVLPRGYSFRPDIWGHALAEIMNRPITGLGINTSDDLVVGGIEFLHPHNMYLSVAYQGGLIAFGLFVSLLLVTLRVLLQHYDSSDAKLALGILGISMPAYLLDGHELIDKVGSTWFLLWLPVGIALGLRWSRPASRV